MATDTISQREPWMEHDIYKASRIFQHSDAAFSIDNLPLKHGDFG